MHRLVSEPEYRPTLPSAPVPASGLSLSLGTLISACVSLAPALSPDTQVWAEMLDWALQTSTLLNSSRRVAHHWIPPQILLKSFLSSNSNLLGWSNSRFHSSL